MIPVAWRLMVPGATSLLSIVIGGTVKTEGLLWVLRACRLGRALLSSRHPRHLCALFALLLPFFFSGCGGASTPATVNQPQIILFSSAGALNGSDASGPQNVWTANGDGSGAAPLTRLTASYSAFPSWLPGGSSVTFTSSRALDGTDTTNANGVANIWVMKPDGSGATALTRLTANGVVANGPVYSPDSQRVAFSSTRALDGSDAVNTNSTMNVWIANTDGSGATPLTRLTANGALTFVTGWSRDGKKLTVVSARALDGSDALNTNDTFNIWLMNPDGTGAVPLTTLTANGASSFGPVYSPNGSKLAFASSRALDSSNAANTNAVQNIWIMNSDGSGATPLTRLTGAGIDLFTFAWSPDSSKIIFTSSRALDGSDANSTNAVHNLWVMNADGSGAAPLTRMTASKVDVFSASWSPDGSRIAFDSTRALNGSDATNLNGTGNVWVMNADGSDLMPVTRNTAIAAESFGPQWKP
jgi:TolB protein